jgi:hypothetical protein
MWRQFLSLAFSAGLALIAPALTNLINPNTPSFIDASFQTKAKVPAEWHGLIPGRSTRQDLVRELGECPKPRSYCAFNLPNEDVYVTLAGAEYCQTEQSDVILLIERELVDHASWSTLQLDPRNFKKHSPKWMRRINYEGYIDEKSGLGLKVFDKRIFELVYFPVPGDRSQCPDYFRRPNAFVEPILEHVPVVSLECPESPAQVGQVLTFKAGYVHGFAGVTTWIVSAGKIVEGQGRTIMKLDTAGLKPGTIEITTERGDSLGHLAMTSCKVELVERP